ncbi:MAG: thiamine diphosphokinase, partial [Streptococcus sp.]
MTKVVLVAGGQLEELPSDADVWIGVDRGSLYLIEQGIVP